MNLLGSKALRDLTATKILKKTSEITLKHSERNSNNYPVIFERSISIETGSHTLWIIEYSKVCISPDVFNLSYDLVTGKTMMCSSLDQTTVYGTALGWPENIWENFIFQI